MPRKRAPGGGRKPIGAFPTSTQLSIRMPDNIRAELEAAAKKRGWSLSQELLWRVRVSLSKDRQDRRDSALRAICFLISAMATRGLHTRRQGKPWYQNPFTFRAFKLGVAKLLDALEPRGEISIPIHENGTRFAGFPVYSTLIKTPEDAAEFAAEGEILRLFHIGPEIFTRLTETEPLPFMGRLVKWNEDYERELYALSDARRDLGIDEPKKPES
jgi:hypothetical protein